MKDLSVNDSIPFHFSKCLNKHLFADTRHKALEFAYVSVEGPITEIEPVDLERDARPMAHRYLGIDVGDAYIADMANAYTSGQEIVVRMRPERWLTADYTHKTGDTL